MRSRIPKGFRPIDQAEMFSRMSEKYPALIRLYIYKDDKQKNYLDATAEEVASWIDEIAPDLRAKGTKNLLRLSSVRKATIDLVLLELCARSEDLFGGPKAQNQTDK